MEEHCEQVRIGEAQASLPGEKHRCKHIAASGRRCGRWASQGEELCHAHLLYTEAGARSRVEVPLLEDEASILHVLSQTAQRLATGGMPPANGNAVISACKLATRLLELRLKREQWQAKQRMSPRAGKTEHAAKDPLAAGDGCASPAACSEQASALALESADAGEPIGNEEPLMAVSDDEAEVSAAAGQQACDRVRARIEAAAAERYAQEGPQVQLPRFRKEDLEKQWERGLEQPFRRNENNFWISKEESNAIQEWRSQHRDLVRAREQRMLDEYFGRVKKEKPAEAPLR